VAGRLGPLRRPVHPHGLAQRRHLPHLRRARRRRHGNQRFAPLNSWPDNVNLDKARRLLWPIKQKYGNKISWADLMILAGNVAHGIDGLQDLRLRRRPRGHLGAGRGHLLGREAEWLGDKRYSGERELENPLAAVQMGLIYVNPEGPNGNPTRSPPAATCARPSRRMAMNDEETVALVAGGHTFGKATARAIRQAGRPRTRSRADRRAWAWAGRTPFGSGKGGDTTTSGIEGAWTPNPTWDNGYFDMLFGYDWELVKSPAGAWQWVPVNVAEKDPGRARPVAEAHHR
jgi:catalase-peroxidase